MLIKECWKLELTVDRMNSSEPESDRYTTLDGDSPVLMWVIFFNLTSLRINTVMND